MTRRHAYGDLYRAVALNIPGAGEDQPLVNSRAFLATLDENLEKAMK